MAQDVFGIAGTTQGPFTIEKAVAEGGFGVVYRALHGAFRAPVALKCLKIPTIPEDLRAGFLERFREEAEMLFRLSASIPEVVRPLHYDVITLQSGLIVPFIALEWLEGHTLWSLIETRSRNGLPPLAPIEAARLLAPVARALEAAHAFPGGPSGPICVVHRDIKPANIFLADVHGSEVIKILDFGIARARDAVSLMAGDMTQSTTDMPLAFTPRYGAPEQWAPKRFGTTGPWTDVWGLAMTFLETLAGRPVIDGDAMAIMGTVLDEKRRPTPRNEGIVVPDALEAVFRRALAVDPRERPANAGTFWNDVERALGMAPRSSYPGDRRSSTALRAYAGVDGEGPRASGSLRPGAASAGSFAVASTMLAEAAEAELPMMAEELELPAAPERRSGPGSLVATELDLDRERMPAPAIDLDWSRSGSSMPPARNTPLPVRSPAIEERRRAHLDGPPSAGPSSVEPPGVKAMIGLPVALALAGILVRIFDHVAGILWLGGQRVEFGPFRLAYVAAALIGAGVVIAIARLIRHAAR
ncbi:serine/threonine protein kinase [Polyangium aurulentum]|uniref:serine/threonine protein kinase n=1 Tax=Polyangium aurulentum TaxID=2567896 RepID=UPI0010AED9FE|nr:serine/threonine-protein kinase [Polyangium aurulentum]UQA58473.1 protein kinase [Polyangium aurulentum]